MGFEQRSDIINVTSILKVMFLLSTDNGVQDEGKETLWKVMSGIQVRCGSDEGDSIGGSGREGLSVWIFPGCGANRFWEELNARCVEKLGAKEEDC